VNDPTLESAGTSQHATQQCVTCAERAPYV
jgi:hypothetical protein